MENMILFSLLLTVVYWTFIQTIHNQQLNSIKSNCSCDYLSI